MKTSEKVVSAALTIVIGVLCLILRAEVISIAMTILGAVLIFVGIMDLIDKQMVPAVVKIVFGVLIIVFGWTIVNAVLYIVAALLLIYGILQLYARLKAKVKGVRFIDTLLAYASPIICIVISVLLFFNQCGVVNWVFIVAGIFTIVEGVLMLIDALKKKN